MFPLTLLDVNEQGEVVSFFEGKCQSCKHNHFPGYVNRLKNFGMRIGTFIEMIKNDGKGPLLVKIDNSRVALARGVAKKIMVKSI